MLEILISFSILNSKPMGETPESKFVSKYYEISETLDLCDIRWVRNKQKNIHYPSKTFSRLKILDYIFILDNLKESIVKAVITHRWLLKWSIKICVPKELRRVEAVIWRYSVEKVFLEISQNSQENTCAKVSFLIKLHACGLHLYQKRDSSTGLFLWFLRYF